MRLLRSKRQVKKNVSDHGQGAGVRLGHESGDIVRLPVPVGSKLPEKRSATNTGDLLKGRIVEVLGEPSSSGQNVNEVTALGVAAVVACVGLLSDMIAKLPISLYQSTDKGPKKIPDHPSIRLLAGFPSGLHTSYELRNLMQTGVGLGGNGYARVFRDAYGAPTSIEWIAPCDVTPEMVKKANGERLVTYKISGLEERLNRSDVIHVRGFCYDGLMGCSPVRMLRESLGTSLSQTKAAGALMKNGAKWPAALAFDSHPGQEKLDDARDEVNRNMAGAMNAGRIPVIGGGAKLIQMNGMSFVDAQFVESRKMELHEVARHYRVPAFMVDSTATSTWGTGIEQQTLGFLNFSLDPYLVAWEQSLAFSLLTGDEVAAGYGFKFDRDALANVALEARAQFFRTMREIGVFSPNDVRAELGLPTISSDDGGDTYQEVANTPQTQSEQ